MLQESQKSAQPSSLEELLSQLIQVQMQTLSAMQAMTVEIAETNKICVECLTVLTDMLDEGEVDSPLGNDKYLDDQ